MKRLWNILSVVLTLAMLLSLAPMVTAEEQSVSAFSFNPTPEQIFCGMLRCTADEFGYLEAQGYWRPMYYKDTHNCVYISSFINEDGSFTQTMMNKVEAYLRAAVEAGEITEEELAEIGIPDNIYDILYTEIEAVYEKIYGLFSKLIDLGRDKYIASFEAFTADFPDAGTFYDKMVATRFGDTPSVEDAVRFLMDTDMRLADGGCIWVYDYTYAEDRDLGYISDYMAPNGAYLDSGDIDNGILQDNPGGARNVYEHLASVMLYGSDCEEAFTILSGYYPDINGDLYSTVPVYSYFYDENGHRITDSYDLINEDGTVFDTGLAVKDYVLEKLISRFDNFEFKDHSTSEFDLFFRKLLDSYNPADDPAEDDADSWEVDQREIFSAQIDAYVADLKEVGVSDEFIWNDMLWTFGVVFYDSYGYIVESETCGYARDAQGDKINIDDVMDADGNLLMGEHRGENICTLLAEYIAVMDTSARLKGDATGDGNVNLSDVSAIMKKAAEWDVEIYETAADANGDGGVTISDVSLTLRYIAGWDVSMVY